MKPAPFLESKSVRLRALAEADCRHAYLVWLNDEAVCRHNSHHVFPYTYRAAQDYARALFRFQGNE